jgi:hypothetical protein
MITTEIITSTEIRISDLPISLQNQIPYSIRTKKDLYNLNELPYNLQYLIKDYLIKGKTINYNNLYDMIPDIKNTGDFTAITNYFDLVVEYLKNYLTLSKGQYPFDPLFYSKLKLFIQTKDTSTQYTLVVNEIKNIARILSSDLSIPIHIKNIEIKNSNTSNIASIYFINIEITVNNTSKKLVLEIN